MLVIDLTVKSMTVSGRHCQSALGRNLSFKRVIDPSEPGDSARLHLHLLGGAGRLSGERLLRHGRHQAPDDPEQRERDPDQEHDPVPAFDRPDPEEQEQEDVQQAEGTDTGAGNGQNGHVTPELSYSGAE